MPYADKVTRQEYLNAYRRRKRAERGLQVSGRKPLTEEERVISHEKKKERLRQWRQPYLNKCPKKRLLWAATRRALNKGLECTITEEDIEIPELCPYLKQPLLLHSPRGTQRSFVMSLDRIDSSLGYIPGNVEVISWLANTMKNNATPEQMLQFARSVLERHESICV